MFTSDTKNLDRQVKFPAFADGYKKLCFKHTENAPNGNPKMREFLQSIFEVDAVVGLCAGHLNSTINQPYTAAKTVLFYIRQRSPRSTVVKTRLHMFTCGSQLPTLAEMNGSFI